MYLYGASGHCKVIIDILKTLQQPIEGIFDDNNQINTMFDIPVSSWKSIDKNQAIELVISIGNNKIRKALAETILAKFSRVIHPSSIISNYATIGEGTVIMPNVVVNADTSIGNHVILNTAAVIEHDCTIHNYVHISPNVSLAGNVTVGEGTHIGIGACVIQGIKIGKWATIGAGTTVINDVPDGAVVVGVPGKVIKINKI